MGSGTRDLKGKRNSPTIEPLEGRIVLSTFRATNVAELAADVAQVNNTSRDEHHHPQNRLLRPAQRALYPEHRQPYD